MISKLRNFREHIAGDSPKSKARLIVELNLIISEMPELELQSIKEDLENMNDMRSRVLLDNKVIDFIRRQEQ